MKAKNVLITCMMLFVLLMPVWSQGAQETSKETTVEIYHFKVPWIDSWELMSQEYEAAHEGIVLETEIVGGGADWRTLLKTKFAAGEAPDIFVIEGYSDYMLWKDYIAPLTDQAWTTHLLPIAKDAATIDEQIIGMPIGIEGYGYIYNKDLFAKAGVSELPGTISEMRQTAEALKNHGIIPFASGFGTWWVLSNHFTNIPFAQQEDPMAFVSALNERSAQITGNTTFHAWQDAFDLVLDNCEPSPLTTDHNTQVTLFSTGEAAMMQQGNWKENVVYSSDPDMNMGLLPICISDDRESSDRIPVGIPFFFVVNSASSAAEQAASKEFLSWLVSSEVGRSYITGDFGAIPAYDNIAADKLGGVSQDILRFAKEGKTIPWMFSYWPDGAVKEFADLGQQYAQGMVSFEDYLSNLQKSWDRLN